MNAREEWPTNYGPDPDPITNHAPLADPRATELAALRAEVTRLREALLKIACEEPPDQEDPPEFGDLLRQIRRLIWSAVEATKPEAALAPTGQKEAEG